MGDEPSPDFRCLNDRARKISLRPVVCILTWELQCLKSKKPSSKENVPHGSVGRTYQLFKFRYFFKNTWKSIVTECVSFSQLVETSETKTISTPVCKRYRSVFCNRYFKVNFEDHVLYLKDERNTNLLPSRLSNGTWTEPEGWLATILFHANFSTPKTIMTLVADEKCGQI